MPLLAIATNAPVRTPVGLILYELATGLVPFNVTTRDMAFPDIFLCATRFNEDLDHSLWHPLPPYLDAPGNRRALSRTKPGTITCVLCVLTICLLACSGSKDRGHGEGKKDGRPH